MRDEAPTWPACVSIWLPAPEGAQGQEWDIPCLRSALPLHSRDGIHGITLPNLAQDHGWGTHHHLRSFPCSQLLNSIREALWGAQP